MANISSVELLPIAFPMRPTRSAMALHELARKPIGRLVWALRLTRRLFGDTHSDEKFVASLLYYPQMSADDVQNTICGHLP
jgi:hypothetical protein